MINQLVTHSNSCKACVALYRAKNTQTCGIGTVGRITVLAKVRDGLSHTTLQTHMSSAGAIFQQPPHTQPQARGKDKAGCWESGGTHPPSINTRRVPPHAVGSHVINFTFERFPPLPPRGAPLITTHRQARGRTPRHTHTHTHAVETAPEGADGRPWSESVWKSARRRLLLIHKAAF